MTETTCQRNDRVLGVGDRRRKCKTDLRAGQGYRKSNKVEKVEKEGGNVGRMCIAHRGVAC